MERKHFFRSVFDTKDDTDDAVLEHLLKENLCLNMVLPLSIAGCIHQSAIQKYKEETETFNMCFKLTENVQISTGSSTDGCSLPDITEIKRNTRSTEGPDEDVMYLFTSLIVDNDNRRAFCRTDSSRSAPGFTRLVFNKDWLFQRRPSAIHRERREMALIERNVHRFVASHGEPFVHRRLLLGVLRSIMRKLIHNVETELDMINTNRDGADTCVPDISFSHHGPAITVDRWVSIDHVSMVSKPKDYVIALPLPRWPREAAEWVARPRKWPSKRLVRQIVNGGCHIVLKGDTVYDDPRDCLLSFSKCEKQLGLSLKVKQKRCYMLFKYLFKYAINKANRGVSTYHCKTIFYHRCEKVPEDRWVESSPIEGLMWLLDDMETFLKNRMLPQFFIPGMNMVSRISVRQIDAILRDISVIKKDPVRLIVELTSLKRFSWISEDVLLATILSPFLSDSHITKAAARLSTVAFVETLLDKGDVAVAISILCDSDNADIMPNTMCIIESVEHAVQTKEGYRSVPLKGLLATLYLQRALELSDECVEVCDTHDLVRSRQLFKDILNDIHGHTWIYGEYMNMLYIAGEFCEIIRSFENLTKGTNTSTFFFTNGIYTTISSHNRLAVDQALGLVPEFTVPSVAYITYRTVLACCRVSTTHEVDASDRVAPKVEGYGRKLVRRLEDWLKEKRQVFPEIIDENVCILLGLLHRAMGHGEGLKRYFAVAENFNGIYGNRQCDIMYAPSLTDAMKTTTFGIANEFERTLAASNRKRRKDIRKLSGLSFRSKRLKLNAFTHY